MAVALPKLSRTGESWYLSNTFVSSGVTLSGLQQVVANPSSLWKAKISVKLKKPDDYLGVRAFIASLDGQYGSFSAGPVDWRGQPWSTDPILGTLITPGMARRSANSNPQYADNPDTSGKLDFALAAPVAANSVTLSIVRNRGGVIRPGQYLQIGDRLHVVTSLAYPDVPGATVTVSLRPWTRQAYPAGTPVVFDTPTSIMRLADPDNAVVEMLSASPQSDLSINLVEAL